MTQVVANLPHNWMLAPFGEVVDILDSQRRPINSEEREKRPGNVPYFGATGQVGWIDNYLFDEELVLLGEDGAPFLDPAKPKAYLIKGKSWVNNHAHVLKGKCGISNRFLMNQLNQVDYRRFVSGTTRLKLPQAPMKQIPLVVAPEPEQLRIVAEIEKQITRLEAGVVALKRVQANLKRYRAAVLKAAVEGRLVPTEAELARREGRSFEPASEFLVAQPLLAVPKKAQAGVPVPPKAKHKEPIAPDATNLPKLPEGWAWATVAQVAAAVQYGSSAKTQEAHVGVPVLRMGNITSEGNLVLDELKYLPADHFEFPELLLENGDLLFNRTNSPELVGKSTVYRGHPSPCSFASYLIRVRTTAACDTGFLGYCLNSLIGRTWIKSVVSQQVGQANVNGSKLQAFVLPLAPVSEQLRITAEVDRRLSVIDELEMQVEANLKRAERLRQAILKRAFEGKLVPQDPNDEPAGMLLERIRNAGAAGGTATPGCAPTASDSVGRGRRKNQKTQPGVAVSQK
jgi:type I restriction enzyme S subunit